MDREEDFTIIKSCLFIRMPKELDHHQALRIQRTADTYIEGEVIERVIFDFEETSFMDSSGIGVIMGRYKKMSYLGGQVMAIHVHDNLKRVFQISGLNKIMEIIEES